MTGTRENSHPAWLEGVADPVRLIVLRLLSQADEVTAPEMERHCRVSSPTMRRHLDALVAVGVIEARQGESDGERVGRPPVRFSLAPAIRDSVRAVLAPSG